jgi:hypothetical protein
MFLKCNVDCVAMTSFAKMPNPHTHPQDNNEDWFHLILILQPSAILLLAPLAAALPLMMHFWSVCTTTSFNISAG